jgi:hypothetical protein
MTLPPREHNEAPMQMYDSINVEAIPERAAAVAGYVDGNWQTYSALRRRFPGVPALAITVHGSLDAHCLDIENGDASDELAAWWVQHQHSAHRPVLYMSVGRVASVTAALAAVGHPRTSWRLWSAHYTGLPHLCGIQCGLEGERAGATQYRGGTTMADYDISLTTVGWLRASCE